MTLTAMRPDGGLAKGREVSLLSVAQASALISSLSASPDWVEPRLRPKPDPSPTSRPAEKRVADSRHPSRLSPGKPKHRNQPLHLFELGIACNDCGRLLQRQGDGVRIGQGDAM